MDDKLARELIDVGKELLGRLATVETLLKGNGSAGFLKRVEMLERKTLWRNPVTYISLVGFTIAMVKLILG